MVVMLSLSFGFDVSAQRVDCGTARITVSLGDELGAIVSLFYYDCVGDSVCDSAAAVRFLLRSRGATSDTIVLALPGSMGCCGVKVVWYPIVCPAESVAVEDGRVVVPAGWYPVGASADAEEALRNLGATADFIANAGPEVWVYLSEFEVMTTEVPCSLYAAFVASGGYDNSSLWSASGWSVRVASGWDGSDVLALCADPDMPVRGVSYYEAEAFSHWLGGSLPTEAQWEVAARLCSGNVFPWGNAFCVGGGLTANIIDAQQCAGDTFGGGPWPVNYDATDDLSPAGCVNMGGNVSEWCRDEFAPSYHELILADTALFSIDDTASALIDPCISSGSGRYAVRGGNFASYDRYDASVLSRFISGLEPERKEGNVGFRVVWERSRSVPERYDTLLCFDCDSPTVAFDSTRCLLYSAADSFDVLFSEPVDGFVGVFGVPAGVGLSYAWLGGVPSETLRVYKPAYAVAEGGSVCVDLTALADESGCPIADADTVCVPVCSYCVEVLVDTLCAPEGCELVDSVAIVNCDIDEALVVDSVVVEGDYLELVSGFRGEISPRETVFVLVKFAPVCVGEVWGRITVFHRDGSVSSNIIGVACAEPVAMFDPRELVFSKEATDTPCTVVALSMSECACGETLQICDAWWSFGDVVADSVVDCATQSAHPPELDREDSLLAPGRDICIRLCAFGCDRGVDTLWVKFRPLGGLCCEATVVALPVSVQCFGEPCQPWVDYNAVVTGDVVTFSCLEEKVYIFDRRGRFVVSLSPSESGEARWDLTDEDGRPVPAGVYYWKSGKTDGYIIVVR